MESIIKNWIKKADNDLKTAIDEFQTKNPATDTICYHAQQCVEKYLKAFLVQHRIHFRRTHDIAELIEQCKNILPDFETLYINETDSLTIYAVDVRYPDDFYMPTIDEVKKAIDIAHKVKKFILNKLI